MERISSLYKFINSHISYTIDPITIKSGKGTYLGKEWGRTRHENIDFYPNQQN